MALLATVCSDLGLKDISTASLDISQSIPAEWNQFMSLSADESQACQDRIAKALKLDADVSGRIWFHLHYLVLYRYFNIVEFTAQPIIHQRIPSAFTTARRRRAGSFEQ